MIVRFRKAWLATPGVKTLNDGDDDDHAVYIYKDIWVVAPFIVIHLFYTLPRCLPEFENKCDVNAFFNFKDKEKVTPREWNQGFM